MGYMIVFLNRPRAAAAQDPVMGSGGGVGAAQRYPRALCGWVW